MKMKKWLNIPAMSLHAALALLAPLISAAALCACAGEPLVWERRQNRPAPAQFDTYHGQTLDFSCAFEGFGALPFAGASDVRLWYQTNGMGAAWWSVPATVSSNVLAAAWPPSADPGADRVTFFFGAPSNAYAAAQVRFRNSPGPSPNNLDPPEVLDWRAELAAVSNALAVAIEAIPSPDYSTNNAELVETIGAVSPRTSLAPATNYTDSATNRLVQSLTDPDDFLEVARAERSTFAGSAEFATSAHRADSSDGLITIDDDESRSAETIFSQIDARTTTNDVCAIVTNETVTPTGDWVLDESRTYLDEDIIVSEPPSWNGSNWVAEIFDGDMYRIYTAEGGFDALELNFVVNGWDGAYADIWYTRPGEIKNALGLARLVDLPTLTNGLIGADFIATNNPAFVAAVTNCPVAIAASDAEALAEWGIYGGGGTIGALLAALAAAVAALKKKKMPLYPVGGTGNPVNATYESGVLTVSPFAMAAYTPTASAAFSVVMGALPSDMEIGKARDAVLVIDCTSLTEGQEPTVTWGANFHPRTDAGTDFACSAGAKNVYYISEYAAGEFAVGGWTETAGENA